MEKWICCGTDIIGLCDRAGCKPPERCFFCGEPRKTVALSPQPEDQLAFELAELWTGKIREFHGDPEAHFPSFDQYGRPDVEAWRRVARQVLELIYPISGTRPDSQSTRDVLIGAIQAYAEEWKAGKSTIHSDVKTALIIALDRHEFEVRNKSRFDLVSDLNGPSKSASSWREWICRSSAYGKTDSKTE